MIDLLYTYDSYGNLWTAGGYATFTPGGDTNRLGYNAAGQVGQVTFGNGLISQYTYEPSTLRLHTAATGTTSTPGSLQNLGYSYYPDGNLQQITGTVYDAGTGAVVSAAQTVGYDPISRLTSAQGPYGTITYAYDTLGNMTCNSALSTCDGVTTFNYQYGGANGGPHAVTTAGSNSYIYDANGNMTSGAGRTLSYDFDNRMTSITSGGTTTTMVYDAGGARIQKKVGNNPTTAYIGKLYECTGTACTKYIFAGNQRVAAVAGNLVYYYHPDHLGSSSVITGGVVTGGVTPQTVVQSISYRPFGATATSSGSVSVHHKYTGQELDDNTGLYYYGARYYDAGLGRFLQADTVVPSLLDPQGINPYSYALNSPVQNIDPSGHFTVDFGTGYYTDGNPWTDYSDQGSAGVFVFNSGDYAGLSIDTAGNFYTSEGDFLNTAGTQLNYSGTGSSFPGWGTINYSVGQFGENSVKPYTVESTPPALKFMAEDSTHVAASIITTFGVVGAASVANEAITIFKTGHYASRLEEVGVNVDRAESAVRDAVQGMRRSMEVGADVRGRMTVDDVLVEYRVRLLPDGTVRVGTIFPVK